MWEWLGEVGVGRSSRALGRAHVHRFVMVVAAGGESARWHGSGLGNKELGSRIRNGSPLSRVSLGPLVELGKRVRTCFGQKSFWILLRF